MVDFELSVERRRELVDLLDDEQAFLTRYPVAADYMLTAPRLAGTGNLEQDSALDLRMLHFLTSDEPTGNPYWAIVEPAVRTAPPDRDGRREVNGGDPCGSARLAYAQTVLQAAYAYPIPSPETLRWIRSVADGRPVVEIGAGRGYWAAQLARTGVAVAAFDAFPPDRGLNSSFPASSGQPDLWYPVGGWRSLVNTRRECRRSNPKVNHVLLLCWPPAWGSTMASRAIGAYERAGGDRLIYIGERRGGKCGDDDFFDRLAASWELFDQDDQFVAWWNLGDVAQCWRR